MLYAVTHDVVFAVVVAVAVAVISSSAIIYLVGWLVGWFVHSQILNHYQHTYRLILLCHVFTVFFRCTHSYE